MENIISIIETYKEDHPEVIITDDMIKGVIEENIDILIENIKKEVE